MWSGAPPLSQLGCPSHSESVYCPQLPWSQICSDLQVYSGRGGVPCIGCVEDISEPERQKCMTQYVFLHLSRSFCLLPVCLVCLY